jgi:uncharacterized glyoxalase superfamily protein PhnB
LITIDSERHVKLSHAVPRLRSFDEAKAREFYVEYLGFKVTYEHRFGENFPLYMEVQRDECVIILSEHYGDACPGASLLITVADIRALAEELRGKDYKYSKPEVSDSEWNTWEFGIKDPFGNSLTFQERK